MSSSTEPNPEVETQGELEPAFRPTHHLKDIKAGDQSLQLLVSTKDHLYDAENVEAGIGSCQVIGAWEESSIPDLANIISESQKAAGRQTPGRATFGTRYGGGHTLGATNE